MGSYLYGSKYDFKMLDPINVHQNQFVGVKAISKLKYSPTGSQKTHVEMCKSKLDCIIK